MSLPRVCFGLPLYGSIHAMNVANLLNHLAYGIAEGLYHRMAMIEGAYVDRARNDIVLNTLKGAEEDGLTHLFFHDQDVLVPEGVLRQLLAHDVPVVAGVYFGRDLAHRPVAFDLDPFRRLEEFDAEGLNKVDGVGMGATLINLDVLRDMRDHYNDDWWFRCTEDTETGTARRTGEDVWFAHRCAEMGVPVYLDGSARCGHVSAVPITYQHYLDHKVKKETD